MKNIINHIQKAVIKISEELKFPDTSYRQTTNSTGDTQLKFDVLSDDIITQILSECSDIKALISEEKQQILQVNQNAKYIIAYDPLDGSSLLDVNFAVGSIFGIYENDYKAKNLKAAIYSMYGARLELIICEDQPKLYRLDKNNKFVFVKNLQMKEKGNINASGGTQKDWSNIHAKFIKELFDEGYRLRYSGAMVSDINQILLKGGGIFSYPSTKNSPNGKLRKLFEVFPLAFIIEKAGGKTTNGYNQSLLELECDNLHESTPCFFGSKYEIDKLIKTYKE